MDEKWEALKDSFCQAYNRFNQKVRQLHPSRREQTGVCGHWSPKEVIAHLAGWDHEATRRFNLIMNGPTDDIEYDLDTFNSRSIAERQHLNWEQSLEDLDEAQIALKHKIKLIEPKHLNMDARFSGWLEGRIRDYKEHIIQIESWI